MKFNWYYILTLVLFASMLFISFRFFRGSQFSTVGITHSREHKINAEKPAMVKAIHVISGQQVKAGDLLVELSSNEVDMGIAKLTNEISKLRNEKNEKLKLAQSEIAFIRADEGVRLEEINTEIAQTESEMKLNQKLTRNFAPTSDSTDATPVDLKVSSLKKQKLRVEEAISIKVKDIEQERDTEQNIIAGQIDLLERELDLLVAEKKQLTKYASADGLVENVYVRPGEQVDAFTSLLSLNLLHPSMVIGYAVGKKEELAVGSPVKISAMEKSSIVTEGKVIGYGAVVALPEILQKSTAVKAFGREIFIEISAQNQFATGEKVLIR